MFGWKGSKYRDLTHEARILFGGEVAGVHSFVVSTNEWIIQGLNVERGVSCHRKKDYDGPRRTR